MSIWIIFNILAVGAIVSALVAIIGKLNTIIEELSVVRRGLSIHRYITEENHERTADRVSDN